ncbi:MAG: hypothetical protein AAFV59_04760 [Pseudomonadota bacterium]
MDFIGNTPAKLFFKKLGIDCEGLISGSRAATRFKTQIWVYQSPLVEAATVSEQLLDLYNGFERLVVWPHTLVWGDRSNDPTATPDWKEYSQWRHKSGEAADLTDRPAHVFEKDEVELAYQALQYGFYLGWDALIGSNTSSPLIELSHNDKLTIHARQNFSTLADRFEKLGLSAV